MAVEIPLFPLGVVLFPHMPLALHIFEQRYQDMIHDCEERGQGFGVVAIAQGAESGPTALPHRVGTLAQVRTIARLDDGRYNLVVSGASRFRILSLSATRTYLSGTVEYLEDTGCDSPAASALVDQVRTRYRRYADQLRALTKQEEPAGTEELPDDPELLSYMVGAGMQIEVVRKQELLELDSAEERLRAALILLRRETTLLDHMLARGEGQVAVISRN